MIKLGGSVLNSCIGELVMDFGRKYYVTATLVLYGSDSRTFFLLTCAHNILRRTKSGWYANPSKITFYRGRSGLDCICKHQVRYGYVHPRYKDLLRDLDDDTIWGVDIAICFFKKNSDKDCGKLKNKEIYDLLQFEKPWASSSKGNT